uniref:Uncharacterized protein n=1 Tax=Candidatus Kentrum sp. MB TaxID=2138164 RepID=A0A450Y0S6_9GAMM|nr:MAG: hypothetical protein BECKMB1821I_GA0114274_11016 [Candidatus Kentron sp. MB]
MSVKLDAILPQPDATESQPNHQPRDQRRIDVTIELFGSGFSGWSSL